MVFKETVDFSSSVSDSSLRFNLYNHLRVFCLEELRESVVLTLLFFNQTLVKIFDLLTDRYMKLI